MSTSTLIESEAFATKIVLQLIVTALLMVQAPLDLRTHQLSRSMTCAGGLAVFLTLTIDAFVRRELTRGLLSGAATAGLVLTYFALHRLSPRSLGLGDVLLVIPLALSIGYLGVEQIVLWQLFSSSSGAVHALGSGRKRGNRGVPFGPHLLGTAWLMLLLSL